MSDRSGKRTPAGAATVSVVICAYTPRRLPDLDQAIDALLRQTVEAAEIVLVIDGAPDLAETCRGRWEDAVRVLENAGERGLTGARNTGVAAAEGEVVAFLDDDAVPALDWIERLGAAYADPAVLGVGGTVRPRWLTGRPTWFPPEYDWVVGCTHSGMPRERRPVRNMVGANMSLRHRVLAETGGFRDQLGRVGANTAGAEETDLCIRVGQLHPEGVILYDPDACVEHMVPADRATFRYFVQRCRGEGRSKKILSGLVGSDAGLREERTYVSRTLPLGFVGGFRDALGGDVGGLSRAATLVAGLAVTGFGYLTGPRPRAGAADRAADEPPRVLMVTPRSPLLQGGVERHVLEVSTRLVAAGESVEVLCAEPGGAAVGERHHDGVSIRSVRAWPAERDYYFAPGIWPQMARRPADVVHVQSYHTLVAPLAMLRALVLRIPYVVTFHGGGHSSGLRNRSRRLQRRLLRPLLARAARLVAVARFEIDEYGAELNLPAERFALIPNGTEVTLTKVAVVERTGPPTIASIGRLERYKGHHRVIRAFPELRRRLPDAKLLIVGSGPYEEELRAQAAGLDLGDAIEFTSVPAGDAEAMAALLGRVSLVILMSEFESHPLVALESASAGCRLLVADAGGLAELAAQGLARPIALEASPAAVAEAAVEELAKPAPDALPDLVTWDECAARLARLYREVAAGG